MVATTFYDIFDGFYHVTLSFNVTIIRPDSVNSKYLAFLKKANNNTAPFFRVWYRGQLVPYFYVPKIVLTAGEKIKTTKLDDPFDIENDGISLSYDFSNASHFT